MFRLLLSVAILCLGLSAPVSAATSPQASPPQASPQATPPLFHGNWCGLGEMKRRPAVDALDAACRAHDLCYERLGRGACSCDRAFLRATAALAQRQRADDTVKTKAVVANTLFALAPCVETRKKLKRARKR